MKAPHAMNTKNKALAFLAHLALSLTITTAHAHTNDQANTQPLRPAQPLPGVKQGILIQQPAPATLRLDGQFNDWSSVPAAAIDAAGDATGSLDLRTIRIANRNQLIWMAIEFDQPVDLFAGPANDPTLIMHITTADGSLIAIDFRNNAYTFTPSSASDNASPEAQPIHWSDLDLQVLPSHASQRFELTLNLERQGVEVSDIIEINFIGSDQLDQTIRFRLTGTTHAIARRPVGPSQMNKTIGSAIRIASLNTHRGGLTTTTEPDRRDRIERIIKAANAEVYCFQDETANTAESIRKRMEALMPQIRDGRLDGSWHAVLLDGCVIASQHPLIPLPAISQTRVVGAIVVPENDAARAVIVYSAHLPAGGYTGTSEDHARIAAARAIAAQIEALRDNQLSERYASFVDAPVVLAGTLNIVGSPEPREILTSRSGLRFAELPNMLHDALETWQDDASPLPPGIRDHMAISAGVTIANAFVVDVRRLGPVLAKQNGMHRADFEASPHRMMILDVLRSPTTKRTANR